MFVIIIEVCIFLPRSVKTLLDLMTSAEVCLYLKIDTQVIRGRRGTTP